MCVAVIIIYIELHTLLSKFIRLLIPHVLANKQQWEKKWLLALKGMRSPLKKKLKKIDILYMLNRDNHINAY